MSDTQQQALAQQNETFSLAPRSMDEALKFCDTLAKSDIVPKDFKGNAGNIMVAVQWGMEIGLKPMQAMQNIAVINGRPSLWGDSVLALVLASPHCKDVVERFEGNGDDFAAVCIAQRHGREDKVCRFSVKDAKAASLIGKTGPWTQYRDRMLKMRARAFALRDQFADVLKGMPVAEEVMDIDQNSVVATQTSNATVITEQRKTEKPDYTQEQFDANFPTWKVMVESGEKSADSIIGKVSTKANMTEEQKKKIRDIGTGAQS